MPTEPRPSKAQRRDEAREKALQLRAEQQKREKRNRIIAISGLVAALVVLAVVVTLILRQGNATAGSVSYTGDEVTVADVTAPSTAHENGGIPIGAEGVAGEEPAADAVVLDLYLDYMCPICGQFEATNEAELASLRESGDVTVVYHPVAILDRYSSGTEYSTRASIAAAVVADQAPEQFLAFNNALLANQPAENTTGLTDDEIGQIALDVDVPQTVVDQFVAPDGSNDWRTFAPYVAGLTADANTTLTADGGQFGTPAIVIDGERWEGDWQVAGTLTEAVTAAKG
jgi:protein-disulfide isomerase